MMENQRRVSSNTVFTKDAKKINSFKMLLTLISMVLPTICTETRAAPLMVPTSMSWSDEYRWPPWTGSPYLYHPSIRWIHRPPIFYVWPILTQSLVSPSSTSPRAQNRLFPSYTVTDKVEDRKKPVEPSQSIAAEHRDLTETEDELEMLELEPASNYSDTVNETKTERVKRQVIFPEDESAHSKHFSHSGKLVFEGLSMLGSALAATTYSRPHQLPVTPHYPPPYPPFPHHPPASLFHPFVYPAPSPYYPPYFPLMNSQSYYPTVSSSYKTLGVDSLLIPLVGMVGLSLLVPDIVKSKREGRPSDFNGLDVYRRLSEDKECLKRIACEAGVVVDPTDDPETIKRVLERGWAAKSLVPAHHYDTPVSNNCGSHNCELNLDSTSPDSEILRYITQRSATPNITETPP